jgi:phosphoribosylformylglycinamidine cyclo-ligase
VSSSCTLPVKCNERETKASDEPHPSDETERYSGDAQRYQLRGVSADKSDVHAAIKDVDKGLFPNAFCKVVPDLFADDSSKAVVMHADGAGTKSSLAYMYWKKTGDLSVWKGIAQDSLVMNLDDVICVGVTDKIALSSTIGRNKNLIPKEVLSAVINGTTEFVAEMRKFGVGITLTGGETADVGDLVRTIIVDCTVAARISRSEVIDSGRIRAGDVIVGLSSCGQATYETSYNSGIGSNGLTAARHDVFEKALAKEFPESFDPMMPNELVYSGNLGLAEPVEVDLHGSSMHAGQLVLSPTRTYAPIIAKILASGLRKKIHGMIHCSGGAQTKVLNFIDGLHVLKDNLFPTPPVFHMIQRNSSTPWAEMYKVFNMGHRMEIYTDQATASSIIEISRSFNVAAQIIGRVEAESPGVKKVTIHSEHGRFEY